MREQESLYEIKDLRRFNGEPHKRTPKTRHRQPEREPNAGTLTKLIAAEFDELSA